MAIFMSEASPVAAASLLAASEASVVCSCAASVVASADASVDASAAAVDAVEAVSVLPHPASARIIAAESTVQRTFFFIIFYLPSPCGGDPYELAVT